MTRLVLFGASDLALQISRVYKNVFCCLVSDGFKKASHLEEIPIFSISEWKQLTNKPKNPRAVLCLGYDTLNYKEEAARCIEGLAIEPCELRMSWNWEKSEVILDKNTGNIFFPNVTFEPGCNVGKHNIFWSNMHVCHDVSIGSYNFFASGSILGGGCKIGNRCFVGFNSVIDSASELKESNTIGANSYFKGTAEKGLVYVGNPAKPLLSRNCQI